jgi:hypothetical protein
VIDGDIPVSAILTSASLHDSQIAIPLAQMSAVRYRERSAVERVNSHLHEQHGRRHVCDSLPSEGAKTVTRKDSAIFTYRTPRGSRLQAGTTRGSARPSFSSN